ncbi:MAG: NAD(P)-binding domain-containing protein [Pseudolabrys sp.]
MVGQLTAAKFNTSFGAPAKWADDCEVAVIGAGPYGLSVGAHLKAANIATRVFGEPMGFWQRNMPRGMRLRSAWRASNLSDPTGQFALDAYAKQTGFHAREQMRLEDFVRYGQWFQSQAVPDLDPRKVSSVEDAPAGFRLVLEDGTAVHARRVVIAMGLRNQDFRPAEFAALPSSLVSHSAEHDNLGIFSGKRIAVVGRGQSAVESAVLAHEGGAQVDLISNGGVHWIGSETPVDGKALLWTVHGILDAPSAVGPFPLNWLNDMPGMTRLLPDGVRAKLSKRSLRPAATAWLRPRASHLGFVSGKKVIEAKAAAKKIAIRLDDGATAMFDHVLLSTGYRMNIARFGVLADDIVHRVGCVDGYPRLSGGFESSVPGLHFVGSSSVRSIGALMRFVAGAAYTARNVTRAVRAQAP